MVDESALGGTVWDALATLARDIKPEDIFDCGANEGQSWSELRGRFPGARIHSFEPNAKTFLTLGDRVGADARTRLVNAAVSDRDGEGMLFLTEHSYSDSLVRDDLALVGTQPVSVVTIDGECEQLGIERVGVLKIDVEGNELLALRGAERLLLCGGVDIVVCELNFKPRHPNQARASEIIEHLWGHGLRLFDLYDIRRPDRELGLGWCDGLFMRTEIHPAFTRRGRS